MTQTSNKAKAHVQANEVEVDPTVDFSESSPAQAPTSIKEGFGVARAGIQKAPKTQQGTGKTARGTNAVVAELERPA